MRITSFLAVAAFLLVQVIFMPLTASAEGNDQIKWQTNFSEALARARSENKPVLLDFFNPS